MLFLILQPTVLVLWSLSLTIIVATLYLPYTQYRDRTENIVLYAFFASMYRSIWAANISWIIFACVKGYGGPINWCLSFQFFQPLTKLSYAVYIIHFPLKLQIAAFQRGLMYFHGYLLFHFFLGILTLSFVLAIPMVLMVEMPIARFEAGVYTLLKQRKEKSKVEVRSSEFRTVQTEL